MAIIPNDVKDIRRGIDHVGVSIAFVIHDGHGKVLLQRRGEASKDERGNWDLGGGSIEFGESIEQAVIREISEELEAKAQDIEFITAYDAHRKLDDGTPTHWIIILHAVKLDPAKISIGEPNKISELGWFSSTNLPTPLHSQFWKGYQISLDRGIVK